MKPVGVEQVDLSGGACAEIKSNISAACHGTNGSIQRHQPNSLIAGVRDVEVAIGIQGQTAGIVELCSAGGSTIPGEPAGSPYRRWSAQSPQRSALPSEASEGWHWWPGLRPR